MLVWIMSSYNVEGIPEYGKDLINRFMRFFRPRSVAVIGASREPGRVGYAVIKNLIDGGYKGKIYPINPRAAEILGLKCYPDIREVPDPEVDSALISIPAAMVPDVIPSLAEKKVPVAVVVSSGFAETGNPELQEKLVRMARQYGVRIIGPNTYGIYSPWYNLSLSFTIPYEHKGGLAVVAQSGGVGIASFGFARWKKAGISINVGLGNMSDIDHADLLWYFYADEHTKAISFHMESIKDGKKFIETAKIVSKKKPIVVLKAGRTGYGEKAAKSHTAALTASDEVINAAFKKAGVIRVYALDELFDVGRSLAMLPPPKGENVFIITMAGGLGVLLCDAAADNNLHLMEAPQDLVDEFKKFVPPFGAFGNPMDITGSCTPDMVQKGIKLALMHPKTDAIIIGHWHTVITPPMEFAKSVVEGVNEARANGMDKPVVVSMSGDIPETLQAIDYIETHAQVPAFFCQPERAVRVLGALYQWARYVGFLKK